MKFSKFLIIPVAFFISCNQVEEKEDLGNYHLFTATFEEGEFPEDETSFIFISDMDGNVLADSSFVGASSISLFADSSQGIPPDTVSVTLLTRNGDSYEIETNMGIERGSDWTYYHPYYETEEVGRSYYNFANINTNLSNVIISSNSRYNNSSINSFDTYELSHIEDAEDVLIMGELNDGSAIYKIIENVVIGDTHLVNMNDFEVAAQIVMNNNSGFNCDASFLYGYESNESFLYYNRHRLMYSRGEGFSWDSNQNFLFNYPPEFGKFRTNAYVGDGWGTAGGKNWYQVTAGDIPTEFEKINADISVINSEINNFAFNLTGTFDQWSINLRTDSGNGDWDVYIAPGIESGKLPLFPLSISSAYPEILREDFVMNHVLVMDFLCASDQKEWHDLYFNTEGYYLDFCSGYRNLIHWLDHEE